MKTNGAILITLVLLLLNACDNSNPGNTDVAEGGVGGTGISTGPVTGFGSIFVNGVKFDVTGAEFIRDGKSIFAENDFSIGEYVTVTGNINADGLTGTASKVFFEDIVEGPVTAVSTSNINIDILGQKVVVDKLTVLIGFMLLTDLQEGNIIEVSGFRNAAEEINATGIKLKESEFIEGTTEFELTGIVESVNASAQTFNLGGLTVDYSQATLENITDNLLSPGMNVEIKSTQILNGSIFHANIVTEKTAFIEIQENTELEIEGLVTQFNSGNSFSVNDQPVITNSETEFKDGAQGVIALNVKVEVEGVFNASGDLIARSVSLRESVETIEIEGTIQALDKAAGEFSVLGKQIIVNSSTIFIDESSDNNARLGINDLVLGNRVEVKGNFIANGKILATRVDREDETEGEEGSETELEGPPENINSSAATFSLFGITITTSESTEFEGDDDQEFTSEAFFQFISANEGIQVKVKGDLTGSTLAAEKIEIDD